MHQGYGRQVAGPALERFRGLVARAKLGVLRKRKDLGRRDDCAGAKRHHERQREYQAVGLFEEPKRRVRRERHRHVHGRRRMSAQQHDAERDRETDPGAKRARPGHGGFDAVEQHRQHHRDIRVRMAEPDNQKTRQRKRQRPDQGRGRDKAKAPEIEEGEERGDEQFRKSREAAGDKRD
jgi:hypothetical protein